jgi:ribosomal protein L11 methyltransferase
VAAVLLGAKEAYAVDIDPQALIATIDTAQKNKVESKIQTFLVEDFKAFARSRRQGNSPIRSELVSSLGRQ